ncbi:MAG: fused MFS/spermidine synthase [Candidatus Accumulibacter sp.]|jgi:predicted membrane-bound spermidine synthase|uniref:fused MFS/spermidine synthase n=1 Tax=Accumulibacter sp. TaxID=2053492 RepID=UPI00259042BE|nr:fused MFS/spermidine synthase [Accumulibacter sp.]MBK8114950.1 fused MFS/spermidine synthase [Accumulibacter sp.]MBK8384567.1 fused MFS/spermidine synthase [Accumulibacter sp.]
MSRLLLFSIVFIEGFCSLGAEVIALRQIIPHLGSSIVVTAPTIGFFLLALALGYHAGAKIDEGYIEVVAKNFLLAALLVGIGLAGIGVDLLFTALRPPELAYLLLVAGVLCPIAWLLGQTVPILTNLLLRERAGEASGEALYYSTLGSFLGSLSLSLLVMQWLGVSAAVALCALLLVIGYTLLRGPGWRTVVISLAVASLTGVANAWLRPEIETAYASYLVLPVQYEGAINGRALKNNSSFASLIDDSEPPLYARYIRHIRSLLLDELGFRERRILVLGAGGFTLSHREPSNHYTYVDIDPAVRGIAEKHFLGEAARGEFIADDARRFVIRSEQRFAAAIVDVYGSHSSIPGHLVTREFWLATRRVLEPEGLLIANLILDSALGTPYSRNLLATIESVYGRCAVEVLQKKQVLANVVVTCRNGQPAEPASLFIDERNSADFDLARSR